MTPLLKILVRRSKQFFQTASGIHSSLTATQARHIENKAAFPTYKPLARYIIYYFLPSYLFPTGQQITVPTLPPSVYRSVKVMVKFRVQIGHDANDLVSLSDQDKVVSLLKHSFLRV